LTAAKASIPEATKAGGRFFVAIVPAPADQLLRDSMEPSGLHLVIASKSKDAFSAEESRLVGGATKVAQVQSKGRSLLEVQVHFRGDGSPEWLAGDGDRARELASLDQRIELLRAQVNEPMLADALKALRKAKLEEIIARREALASAPIEVPAGKSSVTARFVPLESNFPRDPAVAEIEKQYDVDVGLINLAWAEKHGVACPPATPEKPGFVGSEVCSACHPTAAAAWKSTKHVKAYEALVNVGKQHHLDCVSCHVLGWQQPQGVCRIDQTENRREVGCESCHGPGSLHLANPKTKGVMVLPKDATTCVTCHDKENSPQFEFDSYVSKIVVPGHGMPAR
ncbi:MAG TPA: multiheme c-type cytochrome, partial [Archangium sp.]